MASGTAPVLLLGVPAGTSLELDLGPTTGETSSERFRGFANVPFGLHLLRMGDTEVQFFAHSALLPLKYVAGGEFVADDEFRANYAAAFARGEFSTALVPYKDDAWPTLSRFITLDVLWHCNVRLGEWVTCGDVRFASTRRLELLKAVAPRDRFVQGFAHMLRVFYADSRERFLGELQLAFALFLGASSLDALQAWTGTLRLTADVGPPLAPAANDVVDVLASQLRAFPQALLDEAETSALARALQRIVGNAADAGAEARACEALRERIREVFGDGGGDGARDDASDVEAAVVAVEAEGRRPLRVELLESDDEAAAPHERMAWML